VDLCDDGPGLAVKEELEHPAAAATVEAPDIGDVDQRVDISTKQLGSEFWIDSLTAL